MTASLLVRCSETAARFPPLIRRPGHDLAAHSLHDLLYKFFMRRMPS